MIKFTEEEVDTILNGIELLEAQVGLAKSPFVGFKNKINRIKEKLFKEREANENFYRN